MLAINLIRLIAEDVTVHLVDEKGKILKYGILKDLIPLTKDSNTPIYNVVYREIKSVYIDLDYDYAITISVLD